MRFSIARALLARLGAALSVSSVHGNRVLGLHIPVVESAAQAPRLGREGLSEVTLALDYIAAMGHDLRTPLNAILGFSDLLSLRQSRPWSDAQQRSLEIVRERAIDLGALVDDMIDWAKLEAGELELTREEQPVLPLIERALAAAKQRSGSRGLAIELQPSRELARLAVQVDVDASRCVQALLGLLDHAIRSNPGPSVVVRVQRGQSRRCVQVDIFDPGLEIRVEDQSAVFDAFRPSHAPTGHRIAGLQLGPAVARSLLRAHGGDVWFESHAGRGTTFTATIPVLTGGNASRA
jgi:signal transduction histidine kinase